MLRVVREVWYGGRKNNLDSNPMKLDHCFATNNSFGIANLIILTTVDTCLFLLLYVCLGNT